MARPIGSLERLARWCRRKPAQAALSAALILVFCGALAGLFFWQQAEFDRRQQSIEFRQKKLQDDQRRRDALRASAESNQKLAQSELAANRYASAQKFLGCAVDGLQLEAELADLLGPLAAQHQRIGSLVEFYRQADRAERLAFVEQDKRAMTTCEAGLRQLGVLDAKEKWWTILPSADLTGTQTEQVQRDVNHQLILLAALWLKDKNEPSPANNDKKATPIYPAVLKVLDQVQEYHKFRKLPRSVAAHLLETYCRVSQFQFGSVRRFEGLEPATPADCYFVGMALFWMGQSPDDWISKALNLTLKLLGLDLGEPRATSQRLLRRSAAEEPAHFWSHYWLGWVLITSQDAKGAELAFTTCLTLRPDDGPALAERGRALAMQAKSSDDKRAAEDARSRSIGDAECAARHAPHDWYVQMLLIDIFGRLGIKDRAVQAAAHMLELLPPSHLLQSRSREQQFVALNAVKVYLGKPNSTRSTDADGWSILALNLLLLEDLDGAQQAADNALLGIADQPRALAVRGCIALGRDQFKPALADFQAALSKEPQNLVALLGLSQLYEKLGELELARSSYDLLKRLAVTEWQELQANVGSARVLRQQGQLVEASRALERARALDPFDPAILAASSP